MSLPCEAAFSTLTNVDFDPQRFVPLINRSVELRDRLKAKVKAAGGKVDFPAGPATFKPEATLEGMVKQAEGVGLKSDPSVNPDILSLQHTLLFGIKGVCGLCGPCPDPGPGGRQGLCLHPRGPGRHPEQEPGPERLGGAGAQVRGDQPEGHGAAGCGQHRNLWPSGAHQGAPGRQEGKGHPGFRP